MEDKKQQVKVIDKQLSADDLQDYINAKLDNGWQLISASPIQGTLYRLIFHRGMHLVHFSHGFEYMPDNWMNAKTDEW